MIKICNNYIFSRFAVLHFTSIFLCFLLATYPVQSLRHFLFAKIRKYYSQRTMNVYFLLFFSAISQLQFHSSAFPLWLYRSVYALPQLVELLFEPLGNGLSVNGKDQSRPVRRVFHDLKPCLFGREFPSVFLRVEFPCILQRLSLDERCGLPFIEPDKAAEVFDTEHFTEIGKPCCRPCDYRFQKRYFLLVPCVLVGYLPAVLLLHFPYLPAVVCLHGLYPILQGFDGFLVVGYLLMQGGVLPFQRLDLVTAEKRTDALGDVGGCGGCRPFQLLGLYFFFRPS